MKKKQPHIFSGKDSKPLWKEINGLGESAPLVSSALYALACRCQELEAVVRELVIKKKVKTK